MIDIPALSGFLEHFVLLFALFGLPVGLLALVGGFFIYRDYVMATDTTAPEERLAAALAAHEAQLAVVEEQHQSALDHARQQREQQLAAVQRQSLSQLEALMREYAAAGMPDDLQAVCTAALRIDPQHAAAQSHLAALVPA